MCVSVYTLHYIDRVKPTGWKKWTWLFNWSVVDNQWHFTAVPAAIDLEYNQLVFKPQMSIHFRLSPTDFLRVVNPFPELIFGNYKGQITFQGQQDPLWGLLNLVVINDIKRTWSVQICVFGCQVARGHSYGKAHGMEDFWVTVSSLLTMLTIISHLQPSGKEEKICSPAFSPCREILHGRLPVQRAASSSPVVGNTKESMCWSNVWIHTTTNTSVVATYSLSLRVRPSQPNHLGKGVMATVKPYIFLLLGCVGLSLLSNNEC